MCPPTGIDFFSNTLEPYDGATSQLDSDYLFLESIIANTPQIQTAQEIEEVVLDEICKYRRFSNFVFSDHLI